MRTSTVLLLGIASLALVGCGGGNNPPAATPPAPPTGSTPSAPAPVDFNVFTVQLVLQQDVASEAKAPIPVEDQNFVFREDGTTFASVLPP